MEMSFYSPVKSCFVVFQIVFLNYQGQQYEKSQPIKQYSPDSMELAIQAVLNGKLNQSQASRLYGVPQPAISYQIRKRERLKLKNS